MARVNNKKIILIKQLYAVSRVWAWRVSAVVADPSVRAIWGSQNAATPHAVAALVPNASTGPAAQTAVVARNRAAPNAWAARAVHASEVAVVARNRAARAVHASEVAVVLVRTCHAAYPPVSAVALDRRVSTRRRAHVAAATARSDGHLVLDVPRYAFVVVFAIVKIYVLILVV